MFDCSAYLGHGLEWPVNEYSNNGGWSRDHKSDEYYTKTCKQHPINSVAIRDWETLFQEEMNRVSLEEEILSAL